jgi:hypothetical protein
LLLSVRNFTVGQRDCQAGFPTLPWLSQEPGFDLRYTDFAECTELIRHFTDKTVVSVDSVCKTGILSTLLDKTISTLHAEPGACHAYSLDLHLLPHYNARLHLVLPNLLAKFPGIVSYLAPCNHGK